MREDLRKHLTFGELTTAPEPQAHSYTARMLGLFIRAGRHGTEDEAGAPLLQSAILSRSVQLSNRASRRRTEKILRILNAVGLSERTHDKDRRAIGKRVVFGLRLPPLDWPKYSMIRAHNPRASMVVHLRLRAYASKKQTATQPFSMVVWVIIDIVLSCSSLGIGCWS